MVKQNSMDIPGLATDGTIIASLVGLLAHQIVMLLRQRQNGGNEKHFDRLEEQLRGIRSELDSLKTELIIHIRTNNHNSER